MGVGRRLECLQRVVSKLQMEAGLCEEQLNQADALLQSVRAGTVRGGSGWGWAPLVGRCLVAPSSSLLVCGQLPLLALGLAGFRAPGRTPG